MRDGRLHAGDHLIFPIRRAWSRFAARILSLESLRVQSSIKLSSVHIEAGFTKWQHVVDGFANWCNDHQAAWTHRRSISANAWAEAK